MKATHLTAVLTALSLAACAHSDGRSQTAGKQVEVYKSDGSQQCYSGHGTSPEAMKKELQGIRVYAARKDHLRNVAYPAVCGGETGSINVYTIAAADVPKAGQRGFNVLSPQD